MEEEESKPEIGCCSSFCKKCRKSNKFVLFIVFSALFVDCLLLTVVVPIVPNVLRQFDEQNKRTDNTRLIFGVSSVNQTSNVTNNNSTPSLNNVQFFDTGSEHKVEVGLLLGSKVLVQLIVNPFVGCISRRYGYSVPMVVGFFVTFISTIGFAFGNTYWMLLVARAVQGIGSSCASVAGLGMLAAVYTDDNERGRAMSVAISGMALGVMIGPPYGGIMYQFTGKELPFIIIAFISLIDGCLRLCVLQSPKTAKQESFASSSMLTLLKDPYILICSGGMIVSTIAIAVVEPTLPIWMHETLKAPAWQQGVAFIAMTLPYAIGSNLFGCIGNKIGRWLAAILGLLVIAVGLSTIPLAYDKYLLIPPLAVLGLAIGMVSSALFPTMGFLVDVRQLPCYADAYALADACLCLGFLIGPVISGFIFESVGFNWLMWIVAILNVLYSPLLVFLKNPTPKEENTSLIQKDEVMTHYNGDEEASSKFEGY